MTNKNFYFYTAAGLTLIVPVAGRFAFGFIMLILFNLQIITTVMFTHLIALLHLEDLKNVLVSIMLISVTIFFKQLVTLYCPIAALTLGFLMYLPALASVFIEFCYKHNNIPFKDDLLINLRRNGVFSVAAMIIYIVRDIIGYGTITFPAGHSINALYISFGTQETYVGAFIATIPGALVLTAFMLAFFFTAKGNFNMIQRSGVQE